MRMKINQITSINFLFFKNVAILFFFLGTFIGSAQEEGKKETQLLKFDKTRIASESFESVGVFDVNNDAILDLVSGSYWYEGPDYLKRHNTTMILRPFRLT